jgi:hypothetical protein
MHEIRVWHFHFNDGKEGGVEPQSSIEQIESAILQW